MTVKNYREIVPEERNTVGEFRTRSYLLATLSRCLSRKRTSCIAEISHDELDSVDHQNVSETETRIVRVSCDNAMSNMVNSLYRTFKHGVE